MRTVRLADGKTVVAPDGSRIRELVAVAGGSMVHCTLLNHWSLTEASTPRVNR